MTARDIQRALMIDRYRQSLVCPNYTPKKWFECDVFELTKAGYFREFEIKLSRSDFKADCKKEKGIWKKGDQGWERQVCFKHEKLSTGDPVGPKQFFFVTPADLVRDSDIPKWAGHIIATKSQYSERISLMVTRPAPNLHKAKADPAILIHLNTIFYHRFQNMFLFKKLSLEL